MTLSTRMKTELPHMKPGAFLWYDCAPDGGHYWLRGKLVRALKGKKPGAYRLKVDWGKGGWTGYGEEPKMLDYDPHMNPGCLHFENKEARDHIGEVLKHAAMTFNLAGYYDVRVHTEARRMWLEVSPPPEH